MKKMWLALAVAAVLGGSSLALVAPEGAQADPTAACGPCDPSDCVPCDPSACVLPACGPTARSN